MLLCSLQDWMTIFFVPQFYSFLTEYQGFKSEPYKNYTTCNFKIKGGKFFEDKSAPETEQGVYEGYYTDNQGGDNYFVAAQEERNSGGEGIDAGCYCNHKQTGEPETFWGVFFFLERFFYEFYTEIAEDEENDDVCKALDVGLEEICKIETEDWHQKLEKAGE